MNSLLMNWLIGHQTIQGTLSLLHVLVYNLLNVKTSSDDAIQCYYITKHNVCHWNYVGH